MATTKKVLSPLESIAGMIARKKIRLATAEAEVKVVAAELDSLEFREYKMIKEAKG